MTVVAPIKELVDVAALAADEKSAENIVALDVTGRFALADAFVLVSAESERQVQAVAENIQDRLREVGAKPILMEGFAGGRWVLMDFDGVIVHVQHTEEREFYQLERLWKDSPALELPEFPTAAQLS
ncbi:ribosome silencing factor [Dermatophilus congolensis]|uniref:Ribosomal silencing factor RsfS n=1 Tax=Dermatophilus congolensis TaxID=1863 RepID=A0A239VHG6_9MICO|nr:ribosome silencing factor [Dermatophilus congolensis]MBO3128910.1 ribosome silencing factor [Dermatophilus congolensis]MBO3132452.1 ribosome silencing factor [Dermatophilus congolensis]MBO3133387.1 ribosome silencing factor [Dermatophilus congolensis]MBO3135622.1 ribosome silencing factor [Dermatophilus congolensis]MBO3137861.1 ribosome silencing factor [Dermatophilus congolensis]